MPSWSPSAAGFPPQELAEARRGSKRLEYPEGSNPEEAPLRPERHVRTSIATLRRRLIVGLVRRLERCPCCQRGHPPTEERAAGARYEVRRDVAHHGDGDLGQRVPEYGGAGLHPDPSRRERRVSV